MKRARGRDQTNTRGRTQSGYREKLVRREKQDHSFVDETDIPASTTRNKITYKTNNQRLLGSSVRSNTLTFATGPAGTGKTYVTIAEAIPFLKSSVQNKLVFTNPAVEIGEKLGTLPGDKNDKVAVSTRPMYDILVKLVGGSQAEYWVQAERVILEPLGSILGLTYDNAVVILDEAQNSTPEQAKALLTRIGSRSRVVLAGDFKEQKFIDGMSGLEDSLRRLSHLPGVGHVEFTPDDIVRSGFCKDVILAYRED